MGIEGIFTGKLTNNFAASGDGGPKPQPTSEIEALAALASGGKSPLIQGEALRALDQATGNRKLSDGLAAGVTSGDQVAGSRSAPSSRAPTPAGAGNLARTSEIKVATGTDLARTAAGPLAVKADPIASSPPSSSDSAEKPYLVVDDHRYASSFEELNSWEANYRELVAKNGPYSNSAELESAFTYNRQLLTQGTAMANAEEKKLLFAGIGAPVLMAGGAVAAPAAASYAGSLYVGQTASMIASNGAGFLTGGTFGATFEYAKNRAGGYEDTAGGYTAAILSGGLGGTGLRLLPNTLLGRAVSDRAQVVTLGAASGGAGDFFGQLVSNQGDPLKTNLGKVALASGIGGGLGAITPLEVRVEGYTAGSNSSLSIYEGLNTRLSSGDISQMQLRYPFVAGTGNAVVGVVQQGLGTAIDGARQRLTH